MVHLQAADLLFIFNSTEGAETIDNNTLGSCVFCESTTVSMVFVDLFCRCCGCWCCCSSRLGRRYADFHILTSQPRHFCTAFCTNPTVDRRIPRVMTLLVASQDSHRNRYLCTPTCTISMWKYAHSRGVVKIGVRLTRRSKRQPNKTSSSWPKNVSCAPTLR